MRVVGVTTLRAGIPAIRAFVKRHGITYTTLVDPGEATVRRYGLTEYPATVLIDRRGVVRFVHVGFRSEDARVLEARVRGLLSPAAEVP